jgi:hypothetical protein
VFVVGSGGSGVTPLDGHDDIMVEECCTASGVGVLSGRCRLFEKYRFVFLVVIGCSRLGNEEVV